MDRMFYLGLLIAIALVATTTMTQANAQSRFSPVQPQQQVPPSNNVPQPPPGNPLGDMNSTEFKNAVQATSNMQDLQYVFNTCNQRVIVENDASYVTVCDNFARTFNNAVDQVFADTWNDLKTNLFKSNGQ
jgi:hypothetical protein